jgi:hypothetical protein
MHVVVDSRGIVHALPISPTCLHPATLRVDLLLCREENYRQRVGNVGSRKLPRSGNMQKGIYTLDAPVSGVIRL